MKTLARREPLPTMRCHICSGERVQDKMDGVDLVEGGYHSGSGGGRSKVQGSTESHPTVDAKLFRGAEVETLGFDGVSPHR
jgi:hypothetical protein